jgi:glycosyltransferase involved in cell wall biosynthesis
LHVLYSGSLAGAENVAKTILLNLNENKYVQSVCFLCDGREIAKQISEHNIYIKELGMKTGFNILGAIKFYLHIKRMRYDLIHFHLPNALTLIISTLLKNNIIYHEHGTGKKSGLRKIAYRFAFRKAKGIIAVSKSTKTNFINCYQIENGRISLIYNPVDMKRFRVSVNKKKFLDELNIEANKPVIGFVGRLVEQKGCDILLKALKRVKYKTSNFHLLAIGEGDSKKAYEQLSLTLGLQDQVTFLGIKDNIEEYFSVFDMLVVPSRWEPFGLVLLEAMASRVPVLAFAVDGIAEIVRDGKDGLLCEPKDVDDLSEKIIYMLNNEKCRNDLGFSGYYRAKEFDIEKFILRIQNVYQDCLS